MRSMTGFASKTVQVTFDGQTKVNASISIKSLNSRFFEVTCKLPYALNNLETTLIQKLKKKLHRGHVYVTIHMSSQYVTTQSVAADTRMIKQYLTAFERVKEEFPTLSVQPTISDLLRIPNLFVTEESSLDDSYQQEFLGIIDQIIDDLIAAQTKEGTTLRQDIELRLSLMKKEIELIAQRSTLLMEEQKAKIAIALQELLEQENNTEKKADTITETRKTGLYAMLDKMDINEEIVRFKSHLANLPTIFEANDNEKGKRLDFTFQELGREINTIGAKCSDATIGSHAINVKVELEKAREQTQNIV